MKYLSKFIQLAILLLFAGEFVAMSFGYNVVPIDPETKTYFMTLHSVFLTILSVPSLSAMVQNADKDGFTKVVNSQIQKVEESKPKVEKSI
jgi:hypothetical protein